MCNSHGSHGPTPFSAPLFLRRRAGPCNPTPHAPHLAALRSAALARPRRRSVAPCGAPRQRCCSCRGPSAHRKTGRQGRGSKPPPSGRCMLFGSETHYHLQAGHSPRGRGGGQGRDAARAPLPLTSAHNPWVQAICARLRRALQSRGRLVRHGRPAAAPSSSSPHLPLHLEHLLVHHAHLAIHQAEHVIRRVTACAGHQQRPSLLTQARGCAGRPGGLHKRVPEAGICYSRWICASTPGATQP